MSRILIDHLTSRLKVYRDEAETRLNGLDLFSNNNDDLETFSNRIRLIDIAIKQLLENPCESSEQQAKTLYFSILDEDFPLTPCRARKSRGANNQ